MLCDDLGGGREAQEGGDLRLHVADSRCCMAETDATLRSNDTPIKKIKSSKLAINQSESMICTKKKFFLVKS